MNVLICTDESIHALFLRRVLERAGHAVTRQALERAIPQSVGKERAPDVILLDTQLLGSDRCQTAREIVNRSHCPIVLLSSDPPPRGAQRMVPCAASGCLYKPFTSDQLLQAIDRLNLQSAD